MKKYLVGIILLLCSITINAQSLSVSSFRLLDSDLTANTAGTIEKDQNGETAALIKVVTTQTGFTFDGGALGIVKSVQKPSEIWVYVPQGLKKITISHPQLGMLRDYYLTVPIEAARTYEMVLVSGVVQTVVKQSSNSQYLVIQVTPSDAVVELNNEILPVSEGVAQKFLKFGTYDYRVMAQNYHTTAGKITIDDPKEKKILTINLQPAFGWVEIRDNEELKGANVYIDNTFIGKAPLKSNNLSSGRHSIKIIKPLYAAYDNTVIVRDGETTTLSPSLVADFSTVTLTVGDNASIYVNDDYKGNGQWTGYLGSGTYKFEARKESYRATSIIRDISSNQKEIDIQLETPKPIYGELNITSTPNLSNVIIDGKKYGQTPLFLSNLLVGKHQLELRHDGYGVFSTYIDVNEDSICNINAELPQNVKLAINCNFPTADLYIDNKKRGKADGDVLIEFGEHIIKVDPGYTNYLPYEKKVYITSDKNTLDIIIEPKLVEVSFGCDYPLSYLSIDGKRKDIKEPFFYIEPGKHKIEARRKKGKSIIKQLEIGIKHNAFVISFSDRSINEIHFEPLDANLLSGNYNIEDELRILKSVKVTSDISVTRNMSSVCDVSMSYSSSGSQKSIEINRLNCLYKMREKAYKNGASTIVISEPFVNDSYPSSITILAIAWK